MTPLSTVQSDACTFQSLAAAWISICLAAAPPLRTYSWESRMPRLPAVWKLPQTRLRAPFWPGVGYSVVTWDQSQSSSSATSCARPVSVPCPISTRAMRMTTVSSGFTTTQALSSGTAPPVTGLAASAWNGMWKPNMNPPAAAAEPIRKPRREVLSMVVIVPSHTFASAAAGFAGVAGGELDGGADAVIGAAPADVGHLG